MSDLNDFIRRTLFTDVCMHAHADVQAHTGAMSMFDASDTNAATQDFDYDDYYGMATSNEPTYMPATPMPWFGLDEPVAQQAPMQELQELNIHNINAITRKDIDEIGAVLPPQAAEAMGIDGGMTSGSDMSTSTDEETTSDEMSPPPKFNKRGRAPATPSPKKSRTAPSPKKERTTRSASSPSQSSDDEQEKKKKPEFSCGVGGVVHLPVKMPKKNRSLFRKFFARDWQGFRDEAFALARINYKLFVREADKSPVHHMLDNFVELTKTFDQGRPDEYNNHTRKFLAIALEFFESIGDAEKLQQFCEGSAHLICLVCPNKTFNLHSNPNSYVGGDGSVTKHPHCHKSGIHPLAYAMIMADLVKIDVVSE